MRGNDQSQDELKNTKRYSLLNKLLLTIYAVICFFIQIKISIRWGGPPGIMFGILTGVISFGIPPIIATCASYKLDSAEKAMKFTAVLFGSVLFCSILQLWFYSTMMSVHY